jgi:O-antigen ligase
MSRREFAHKSTKSDASDRAWPWVALLLSLALFGLVHDLEYATAWGNDSAEAGRYFERQAEFQSDVNNVGAQRKVGFACLLLVGTYCVVSKPRGSRFQLSAMSLVIALGLLWTLASVAWSVQPTQTARELLRLFSYLFVAAALALRFDPRSLCLLLVTALMVSVGVSFGVEVVTGGLRPWVPDYRLSGSMHSAAMGYYSMLIVLASYVFAQQTRSKFWWCVFLAATGVLLLSKALTSLIAGAAGIAAYHLVGKSREKLVFGACCAASFIAMAFLVTSSIDFWSAFRSGHVDTLGRDFDFTSFNGRIPLWSILIDRLQGHWIDGFGYGGFWVTRHIDALHHELSWYPHHAHSAYLGTIVHVGVVGLVLLLATAVMAFGRTIGSARTLGSPEFYVFAAWLAAAFVISIAETSFVEPRDIGLFGAAIVFSCITARQSASVSATIRQRVARVAAPARASHGTSPEGRFA